MDLRSLRQFLVLAEELHFGRAAERLCISQPPLSKHIQQMESRLGVKLFERNQRNVRLTPSGIVLVEEARRLLAQAELAVQTVQRAQNADVGRVRIGFVAAAIFMDIERMFAQVERKLPGIDSVWQEMSTSDQVDALLRDRIDLGFAQAPQGLRNMASKVVARVPLAIALPMAHPLAALRSVPLAVLVEEPFVMLPRESAPGYHDLVTATCMQVGFSPNIRHYANHLLSVISLVAMGRGVSLVPQMMNRATLPGVALKPIKGIKAQAEYSVIWNPDNPLRALPRVLAALGV
jgi:DNA-binding transcriptional LysR family regulator